MRLATEQKMEANDARSADEKYNDKMRVLSPYLNVLC